MTTLTPTPGLTALIGINGSGKSNLLSALLLLQKATSGEVRYYHGDAESVNRSFISARIDIDRRPIELKGEVFYVTNNRNVDEITDLSLRWNLQSFTGSREWIDLPLEMLLGRDYRFVVSPSGRRLSHREMAKGGWYEHDIRKLLPEKVFPVVQSVTEYLCEINYYSASQFSDPSRCPVSLELEEGSRRRARRRDAIDHEQFIYDVYRAWKSKSEAFERYQAAVGSGGINLVDRVRFNEIPLPTNVVEIRAGGSAVRSERTKLIVVPIFTVQGVELSPNQLSEGTFKTLALLFYVMTDQSRLLLLEEPEVSIHHGLLSSVMTLIKEESRQKQIVISTHSDFVLDQLDPDDVVLIEKKHRGGTKARRVPKAISRTEYRALRRYLQESGNLGEYWREGGFDADDA